LNFLGEFAATQAHYAQGIALYDPLQHRSHAVRYGLDAGVMCRAYAGVTLWWLGYPDQALQRSHEALTLARELAHLYSLAAALLFAAILHQLRWEEHLTRERAEELLALSREHEFPQLLAGGRLLQGWALAEQGRGEEGMAQMRQGLAAWHATGAKVIRPYGLALLAAASAEVGRRKEGLTLLSEALEVTNDTGERRWEAELHRLKGELPLTGSAEHATEAETCFRQALDVARRQQAKSWELRAATSLSRLWQRQGKRDAARQVLAEVYGWFTEGFDTADLQEARALLDQLL
jgi:predicted ATPase